MRNLPESLRKDVEISLALEEMHLLSQDDIERERYLARQRVCEKKLTPYT